MEILITFFELVTIVWICLMGVCVSSFNKDSFGKLQLS